MPEYSVEMLGERGTGRQASRERVFEPWEGRKLTLAPGNSLGEPSYSVLCQWYTAVYHGEHAPSAFCSGTHLILFSWKHNVPHFALQNS